MKISKYIHSYSTVDCKKFLKKINGKYEYFVDADMHYCIDIKQDAYDKNGNYLGIYNSTKTETKRECRRFDNQNKVVQFNYNFYLLPIGRSFTIDEVEDAYEILNNSFDSKFLLKQEIRDLISFDYDFYRNEENFTPYEVCLVGNSQNIYLKNYKLAINFDIKKYTKNKNNFILKNPKFEKQCELLYYKNIQFMMSFWQMTEKQIMKGTFNKRWNVIQKLNRKITNYETSK